MKKDQAEQIIETFLDEALNSSDFDFLRDLKKLNQDAEAYLVGGAVRDILLGRKAKDFDFVIRGIESEELEDFLVSYGKLSYVGKQFGVYKLRPYNSDEEIDIAFPRREKSKGHGYKEFEIIADPLAPIQEDLTRRDFTINAFAFLIDKGTLVDTGGGLQDLDARLVKTVGSASQRFAEDYTRILRAVRQAIQLDFDVEKPTKKAIQQELRRLEGDIFEYVSTEMVTKEFTKAYFAHPLRAIELYDELGILHHVLPEVEACKGVLQNDDYHPEGDVFEHIKRITSKLEYDDSERLKLAALFHDIAKPHTHSIREKNGEKRHTFYRHQDKGVDVFVTWASRLTLPGKLVDDVSFLIKNHLYLWHGNIREIKTSKVARIFLTDYELGKDLLKLHLIDISYDGDKRVEAETYIREASEYIRSLHAELEVENKRFTIPINGSDILEMYPDFSGKQIGEYLNFLQEVYLDALGDGDTLSKLDLIDMLKAKFDTDAR